MNMKRNLVVLFVLVALVGMASAKSKGGKESVNITLDQKQLEGKPEAVMSAWMGYGMARANWISEHVLGKSDRPKDYHRGFEEELAGRESLSKIWSDLKGSDATLKDAYLDQLATVEAAGFMSEYVWTYLGSPEWKDAPQGLRLAEFEKWKTSNLADHKVETCADVTIEEKAK